jgi:hypothetical protein
VCQFPEESFLHMLTPPTCRGNLAGCFGNLSPAWSNCNRLQEFHQRRMDHRIGTGGSHSVPAKRVLPKDVRTRQNRRGAGNSVSKWHRRYSHSNPPGSHRRPLSHSAVSRRPRVRSFTMAEVCGAEFASWGLSGSGYHPRRTNAVRMGGVVRTARSEKDTLRFDVTGRFEKGGAKSFVEPSATVNPTINSPLDVNNRIGRRRRRDDFCDERLPERLLSSTNARHELRRRRAE